MSAHVGIYWWLQVFLIVNYLLCNDTGNYTGTCFCKRGTYPQFADWSSGLVGLCWNECGDTCGQSTRVIAGAGSAAGTLAAKSEVQSWQYDHEPWMHLAIFITYFRCSSLFEVHTWTVKLLIFHMNAIVNRTACSWNISFQNRSMHSGWNPFEMVWRSTFFWVKTMADQNHPKPIPSNQVDSRLGSAWETPPWSTMKSSDFSSPRSCQILTTHRRSAFRPEVESIWNMRLIFS